jgi:hypothetical protein
MRAVARTREGGLAGLAEKAQLNRGQLTSRFETRRGGRAVEGGGRWRGECKQI